MSKYTKKVPHLSTEQMIEVDRLMIEKYHIDLIQMMENAGRNLALLSKNLFKSVLKKKKIVVLAGTGGNGGGALVSARRLHTWGFDVIVVVTDSERMTPVPGHQLDILENMDMEIVDTPALEGITNVGLVIDGVIGYSINGNPIGAARIMIDWANKQEAATISLDTPSGINLTTGEIYEPSIRAEATLTLALPKEGLFNENVIPLRGRLYLGDISVPPALYAEPSLNLKVKPIFKKSDILRID